MVIKETRGTENQERLQQSQAEWDVYTGNIKPYVEAMLTERFSASLVREVPIVSSINILKKTTDSKATLYNDEPVRVFSDLTEDQKEKVTRIYNDMRIDFTMLEANRLFELQKKQTHVLIEPMNGKLRARPLKAHQLNVVNSQTNPEMGEVYIFSSYDKELNTNAEESQRQDGYNQAIADLDDYKKSENKFIVWSKNFHFVMDKHGNILSESVESPIAGVLPIVEISAMKDFNYWREITNDVADFCIFYNTSQSMLQQIVEMQGFAQAWLKAPDDLMPQYVDIGPNRVLRLIQPSGGGEVDFGFSNPSSDIGGAQAYMESLLAQFLSSQGLDSSSISGQASSQNYGTGIERLLAQIERFESSKESMALFREAEQDIWDIVKAWHNAGKITGLLNQKYITQDLPEKSEITITYLEPQNIMSDAEKLEIAERRMELGLWSRAKALSFLDDIPLHEAEKMILPEVIVPMVDDSDSEDME